jgi:transposase
VITVPAGVKIYLACGVTDTRRGFDGLSIMAQDVLKQDPFSGAIFCFRGRRGDRAT